jgi:large subunit ribosomal protein L23
MQSEQKKLTTNVGSELEPLFTLIKYPLFNQKAIEVLEFNKYTFLVDKKLNKFTIKLILEYLFGIKIKKINTVITPLYQKKRGKYVGFKPNYKKVICTLKSGSKINLFPNL